jgi:hypothetical protein
MIEPPHSGFGKPSQDVQSCGVCGGDGRIDNAFGQTGRCPSCHGTGRRAEDGGFRDVTKTKASHHHPTNRAPVAEKQTWPTTASGVQIASQIRDAASLAADAKTRLIREIIDHESTHGTCTQTFLKKLRKQLGPQAPR